MTRKNTPIRTVLSLSALALLITGAVLYAGPLNPPAGPIVSTGKTLTEVEPRIAINATNTPGDADSLFKITQSGSYYLTGNITGVIGKHGIEIAASGVTLNLMGFDLLGVPGMGAFDGVSVTASGLSNVTVIGGSVRNWGDEGIDFSTMLSNGGRIEGITAGGNAGTGIACSNGASIVNCTASGNAANGFAANVGCTFSNCTAISNGSSGFSLGVTSVAAHCAAYSNTAGGFTANSGCNIAACVSSNSPSHGFNIGNGNTISACVARLNTLDGIVCGASNAVTGNACYFNGSNGDGAGIHAVDTDNRIEGNNCTGADRGIDVDAAGNIIIRNTCSGNTNNWDVVAGNVILVVNATTAAAVTGNAGGTAPGSTDPNANFSY